MESTIKVSVMKKSYKEFTDLHICQELRKHTKAIWCMKFSVDRKYLATGGEDGMINIWKVRSVTQREWRETHDHRIFEDTPIRQFNGHKSHIVDFAWSKSGFLLSASLDCTVRLWHISNDNCLCVFKHKDMVTSVDFYPEEECYFLTGSMDKKLRVWSIPQGCVVKWVQAPSIITTVTFCPGGRLCAAGLSDGQVIFYYADGLRYFTQTECRNRYGKDKKGRKVTGITFLKKNDTQCMLVTTNDSRIRLLSMDTFGLISKFKGNSNRSMQLRATTTSDKRYIACGSDEGSIFIWRTKCDLTGKATSQEGVHHYSSCEYFRCCLENETVSSVLFAPDSVIEQCRPGELASMAKRLQAFQKKEGIDESLGSGFVFVVGTTEGYIHVFDSFSLPVKV